MKKYILAVIVLLLILTGCNKKIDMNEVADAFTIEQSGKEIAENFNLPKYFEYNKTIFDIEWNSSSSNLKIVENENEYLAEVSLEKAVIDVNLTAILSYKDDSIAKEFGILLAINPIYDKNNIINSYSFPYEGNEIFDNIELPSYIEYYNNTYEVEWSSSNPLCEIIKNDDGYITNIHFEEIINDVTITLVFSYGGINKEFNIVIMGYENKLIQSELISFQEQLININSFDNIELPMIANWSTDSEYINIIEEKGKKYISFNTDKIDSGIDIVINAEYNNKTLPMTINIPQFDEISALNSYIFEQQGKYIINNFDLPKEIKFFNENYKVEWVSLNSFCEIVDNKVIIDFAGIGIDTTIELLVKCAGNEKIVSFVVPSVSNQTYYLELAEFEKTLETIDFNKTILLSNSFEWSVDGLANIKIENEKNILTFDTNNLKSGSIIILTANHGDISKEFKLVVPEFNAEEAINNYVFSYEGKEVFDNFNLLSEFKYYGETHKIEWISSNNLCKIINKNGCITDINFEAAEVDTNITLIMNCEGIEKTVSFKIPSNKNKQLLIKLAEYEKTLRKINFVEDVELIDSYVWSSNSSYAFVDKIDGKYILSFDQERIEAGMVINLQADFNNRTNYIDLTVPVFKTETAIKHLGFNQIIITGDIYLQASFNYKNHDYKLEWSVSGKNAKIGEKDNSNRYLLDVDTSYEYEETIYLTVEVINGFDVTSKQYEIIIKTATESVNELNIYINQKGTSGISFVGSNSNLGSSYKNPIDGIIYNKGDLLPMWKEIEKIFGWKINDAVWGFDSYSCSSDSQIYYKLVNNSNLNKIDVLMTTYEYANKFAKKNKLVNLVDYLDYMPNLSKLLEEHPAIKNDIMTSDGKIYVAPYFDGIDTPEKMFIFNTELIEKLLDNEGAAYDETIIENGGIYTAFIDTSKDYKVKISINGRAEDLTVKSAKNPITAQNELATKNGKTYVEALKAYIDAAYMTSGKYTKRSEVFTSEKACYTVDDMIALMRCAVNNSTYLYGAPDKVHGLIPRGQANNRVITILQFAQVWGIQGLTAETDYLYFDKDGNLCDARTTAATYDALEKLHALKEEGLIIDGWENSGLENGTYYTSAYLSGKEGAALMIYDYNATQTVWNNASADSNGIGQADSKYTKIMPVLPPLTKWVNDNISGDKYAYTRYMEDTRSLKGTGSVVVAKDDEAQIIAACQLIDYFYSEEGAILQNYGPKEYREGIVKIQGVSYPKINSYIFKDDKFKILGWSDWYRMCVGSAHGIGHIRSDGLDFQNTHDSGKIGLANILNAISSGAVICATTARTQTFGAIVPSRWDSTPETSSISKLISFWNQGMNDYNWRSVINHGWTPEVTSRATLEALFKTSDDTYLEHYKSLLK